MKRSSLTMFFFVFGLLAIGILPSCDEGDTCDEDVEDDHTGDDDDAGDDDDDVEPSYSGLIPGPGEPGFDEALEAKAQRYAQQYHGICTVPTGMFLEAFIPDPSHRALVEDWLENSDPEQGFEEYTGVPLYDIVERYGQYGDTGAFGGVAALGVACRYALARDGADPTAGDPDVLREHVLGIMEMLHIDIAITGVPGRMARGIRPLDTPGYIPETFPLFDPQGNPQPDPKRITWREDNSGLFPDYIWEDDISKDQLNGYILAMGVVWDVVADDPDISQEAKQRLKEDAASLGDMLLEMAPETGLPLCIRDADGRLTNHHDLHPREIEGLVLPPGLGNGFNAVMSLGMLKTIAFITGEQRFKDHFHYFLSGENFPKYVDQTFRFTYTGPYTNWSNINMAYSAIYPLLRYEADPGIFAFWQQVLERDIWHSYFPGWDVAAGGQAYFALIYAAYAPDGTDCEAAAQAASDLAGFPDPPSWDRTVINCSDEEIAAGFCIAVDGETGLELAGLHLGGDFIPFIGHNDTLQAVDPVPRHVRPDSNFHWRLSPHKVNGEGSDRLNPGGDFHGVYWLGRYLRAADNPRANVSEHAW